MSCDPFRHQYSVDVDRDGGCGNISSIDVNAIVMETFNSCIGIDDIGGVLFQLPVRVAIPRRSLRGVGIDW